MEAVRIDTLDPQDHRLAGKESLPFRISSTKVAVRDVTAKPPRHLGLAESVIRRTLADPRERERKVLHATDDGRPVCLRMGYQPVLDFLLYAPA